MKRASFNKNTNSNENKIKRVKPIRYKSKNLWINNHKLLLTTLLYVFTQFIFSNSHSQTFCQNIELNTSKTIKENIHYSRFENADINSGIASNIELQKDLISWETGLLLTPKEEEDYSQEESSKLNYNLSLACRIGLNYADDFRRHRLTGFSLNYRYNHFLLSSDYHYFNKFWNDYQNYKIISISAGARFFPDKYFSIDTQIGLGAIWTYMRIWQPFPKDWTTTTKSDITFNIKSGIKFTPVRYFAVGLDALVCFNSMKNIYASMISFEIGIIH